MYGKKHENTPEVFEFALNQHNCKMTQGHQFGMIGEENHGSREENNPLLKIQKGFTTWQPDFQYVRLRRYNMV
jgi:hypothetical protein